MMRDARFFILIEKHCQPIIEEIEANIRKDFLKSQIAIYEIYHKPSLGYAIISVSDEVDNLIRKYSGEESPNDLIRIRIKEESYLFPCIYGTKELSNILDYLIPHSPLNIKVPGKSGVEYSFSAFNITDEVREDANGVYIFTTTKLEKVHDVTRHAHVFLAFFSIQKNNKEVFKMAKEKKAQHFLYYYSGSENERRNIISDIKASEAYQYQLESCSELIESMDF